MPLSINVGLSRKASRDFQSTGCSINVVAELDSALLAKPDELQRQIADLYGQAEQALGRQVSAVTDSPATQQSPERQTRRPANGNGHRNGNGNGHGNGQRRTSQGDGSMTESQRRAILAIAKRSNVDATIEAREFIGTELDDLSLRQASELIDHLKEYTQPANGNGR